MLLKGWKDVLLIISIVIIFVLFNVYSIKTFLQGDKYSDRYNRSLFIVAGIRGVIGIIFGYLIKVETVGLGLIIGGLLVLAYGIIRYWRYTENIARVIILGVALVILIWLGYYFWNKREEVPIKQKNK